MRTNRYHKLLLLLALVLVAGLTLVACGGGGQADTGQTTDGGGEAAPTAEAGDGGGGGGETTTVSLWFHSGRGSERDALNQNLENFAAEHDNIEVQPEELPEGSYNDQVQAAAFANDLPCLLDFDGPFMYNYAWGGFLRPLDDYVSEDMKNDFLPSIIDQGTFQDGKLYSLGQFDSGLSLYANKSYLEEAGVRIPTLDDPWTKEEFTQALADLQALDDVEYALDTKQNYTGEWKTYGFSPVLQSFGGDLIDRSDYQSADGVLNGPESVAAMEYMQMWYQEGYSNPDPPGDVDFVEGRAALSWTGHWDGPRYMEELGDDFMLLPMPDFGNGPKTGMGSWNWGITTNCENPDAAWEVLNFILQPDQILIMTNANGAVPARQSALEQSELYGPDGALNLFVRQLQSDVAVPRPKTPAYPAITSAFQTAFNNIKDGADVQEQLDNAVGTIDQDIEENNGYPLGNE